MKLEKSKGILIHARSCSRAARAPPYVDRGLEELRNCFARRCAAAKRCFIHDPPGR